MNNSVGRSTSVDNKQIFAGSSTRQRSSNDSHVPEEAPLPTEKSSRDDALPTLEKLLKNLEQLEIKIKANLETIKNLEKVEETTEAADTKRKPTATENSFHNSLGYDYKKLDSKIIKFLLKNSLEEINHISDQRTAKNRIFNYFYEEKVQKHAESLADHIQNSLLRLVEEVTAEPITEENMLERHHKFRRALEEQPTIENLWAENSKTLNEKNEKNKNLKNSLLISFSVLAFNILSSIGSALNQINFLYSAFKNYYLIILSFYQTTLYQIQQKLAAQAETFEYLPVTPLALG